MTKIDVNALRPLAFPEHFSLGEQSDARLKLREALGETEQSMDAEHRERHIDPVQNVQ